MSLLEVTGLRTEIGTRQGRIRPVDGVSFSVAAGETLGLVGESGSGKTMTGMSIMRLLPPGGEIAEGSIRLDGRELTDLSEPEMRKLRGNRMAMIFQDPMTSLNPVRTIGSQLREAYRLHRGGSRAAATARATEVLGLVGMPRPRERLGDYPHQLSGGMRQRVMIALGLMCEPGAADRRRADHRPRRLDPGADPDLDRRPEVAAVDGRPADHPRPGRDRGVRGSGSGDVRRAAGGADRRTGVVRRAAASVHGGVARRDADAGAGQERGAGDDSRRAAEAAGPGPAVPFRAAVCLRPGRLPRYRSGAGRGGSRPYACLFPPERVETAGGGEHRQRAPEGAGRQRVAGAALRGAQAIRAQQAGIRTEASCACCVGCQPDDRGRRDVRHRRGVRVRQDHDRPHAGRSRTAEQRLGHLRRSRPRRSEPQRTAPAPTRPADDVPGLRRRPRSSDDGGRADRRAAASPKESVLGGSGARRLPNCWTRSDCLQKPLSATRTSSPAVSDNGSRWLGPLH